MKKSLFVFLILFFLALSLLPWLALAIEYPFPGLSGNNITPCQYIKALYKWALGIVGAVTVASIAYGGFRYLVGQVEQGKEIIYSALIGLLILLGSWLILYTINPDLATLKCAITSGSPPAPPTTPTPTPSTPPGGNDQVVRDHLTSQGIQVNKQCQNSSSCGVPGGQTCLNGLQENTQGGVETIKQNCNCNITITGGTECGHASGANSHSSGKKLDLRPESGLDSYVQNQGCGKSPQDTNCRGTDGNIYRYETTGGAHWDVCFACQGATGTY
jgi:hypothetical protein